MHGAQIFIPTGETFPKVADAVVIGAGIVGVATAFWLSRAGLDTVVIERRDGLATLTTPKWAECFRAQFTEPGMVALAYIGGHGSIWGGLLAALLVIPAFEYLKPLLEIRLVIYSVFLILTMIVYPTGLADMFQSIRARLWRRKQEDQ